MKLRTQLLLLQLAIVLVAVVGTGLVATGMQEQQLRNAYRERMVAVSESIARLPVIINAFDDEDPSATIQPVAEVLRKASDLTYIVVTDSQGIRYSHPNPEEIGQHVSTDPTSVLEGKPYYGTQTGTLGTTWRVKLPIFGPDGSVIGIVSTGVLETQLQGEYLGNSFLLFLTIGGATIFGVIGAAWVSSVIRKRIHGLEPDEIVGLLETREAMLHGVREGIVAVDDSGRIALINDAAAGLLGIDPTRLVVGLPADEVLDPELMRLVTDSSTEPRLVLSGERVLLVRRDVATIDHRPVGALLILRDNTELHAVLRDLDGAQDLADGLRAQAHEFANKLHVISGLLELGHTDEVVAFIERAGNGGTLTSVTGSTGIKDLEVAALILVKQTRARELGTTTVVDPASTLDGPAIATLRNDLLTVIGNLLDNAIEACTSDGRVTLSIMMDSQGPERENVVVVVTDNGPGIAPELRQRVFEPGFSSKSASPTTFSTGRGIGLALVKRVVERHGGTVRVEDAADRGTRFTVRLPLATGQGTPLKDQPVTTAKL